jgi:hypothetical protein
MCAFLAIVLQEHATACARQNDTAMLAELVLPRTGRRQRSDASRYGCACQHGVAVDRGAAWPLELLEVL